MSLPRFDLERRGGIERETDDRVGCIGLFIVQSIHASGKVCKRERVAKKVLSCRAYS